MKKSKVTDYAALSVYGPLCRTAICLRHNIVVADKLSWLNENASDCFTHQDHNNVYKVKRYWHKAFISFCVMFIQPQASISSYFILVDKTSRVVYQLKRMT